MDRSADGMLPGGRLLVVDDDLIIRAMSRAVLEKAGYTVYDCVDGESAIKEFIFRKPDIVLLDVIMPGKSGFEVCAEIRSLPDGIDIPIVMMTGLDDTESLLTAFRQGATDFITKPITWETLPYRMRYIFKTGKAFRDLRDNEKKLSHAQHIAKMGSWQWSPKSEEVLFSNSCRGILGLRPGQSIATVSSFSELVHATEKERFEEALSRLIEDRLPLNVDCKWSDISGQSRYFHVGGEEHRDSDGTLIHITGTIQDITERKLTEEKIRYLAYYDSLTGLPNRTLFKEHLKRAIVVAKQHHHILAVLFFDLDRFKAVNDSMGHDAGDSLLQAVAERIKNHVRGYDTLSRCAVKIDTPIVSRLGGDEFTILLEGISAAETAAMVARRVIATMESEFVVNGQEVFISASIGISIYPDDGEDVDSLVKCADIAMYSAKDFGRGAYQYYKQEMNETSMRRLVIENHLRRALEEKALTVVFQRQVNCLTNRMVGLEALLRWESSELGAIDPDIFISVAEETGLIIALDRWVLKTVCRQLAEWKREGICPDTVSVNISARHFQKRYLQDSLDIILNFDEELRQNLGIEITERSLLDNTEGVIEALDRIAESNIRISLDDFGTGYSSLSYLARIPCHTLKIDKSFVARINRDQNSMNIIIAIIALAKSLKKEVVAEGVETVEQLDFLRHHGCTVIQGYLFHRPAPARLLHQFLPTNPKEELSGSVIETVSGP
jgi:diguanylate cyclase (GGDEF)-like protein/PAS domain S-box-containing protein